MSEEKDSTETTESTIETIFMWIGRVLSIVFVTANAIIAYLIWDTDDGAESKEFLGFAATLIGSMTASVVVLFVVMYVALWVIVANLPKAIVDKYQAVPEKENLVIGAFFAYVGFLLAGSMDKWYWGVATVAVIIALYLFYAERMLTVAIARDKIPAYRDELIELYDHIYRLEKDSTMATEPEMLELNRLVAKLNERVGLV